MRIIDKLALRFTRVIISFPKTVLFIFLLITSMLGWQARHFEINASANTLLMKEDRNYLNTQSVNRRFSPQEFMLIAYKPKQSPLLSQSTFRNIQKISKEIQRLERVQSVRSILNVPLFWLKTGNLSASFSPESLTMEKQNYSIAELKDALGGDPIYEDILVNKAFTTTAIQVLFKNDPKLTQIDYQILDLQMKSLNKELSKENKIRLEQLKRQAAPLEKKLIERRAKELESIRRIVAQHADDADIYIGGINVLAHQLIDIIKRDLLVFGAAIAVMICLVLLILFRGLPWILIPMVCCSCSLISTLGVFGLLHFQATVISSSFVALQLILTLGITVHLIVHYRESSAKHPEWSQEKLVKDTIEKKSIPCLYAGFINIVGFASLLFSNIKPVIDFGWMMSIAMLLTIFFSLMLFPALLVLFTREKPKPEPRISRHLMAFFTRFSLRHPVAIGVACLGTFTVSVAGVYRLDVENSFLNYFHERTQVHRELSFIDQQFGGTTPLDLIYTIPKSERKTDLLMTANTVQTLQKIQSSLQSHPAVGKVLSVVNFTEIAKEMNDNKPLTEYELTAIYWLTEKSLRDELLGSFFSKETSQVRFSIRIKDATEGLKRSVLLSDIHEDMKKLGIPRSQYSLTNLFILYEDILQQLYQSQIKTIGVAFAVLCLTFLLVFRSFKLALIGIIPNILSTLLVLGIMGWAGIPLDLMTIMIAAIAMGISVDDTIHYLDRYLRELRDHSPDHAIEKTNTSVAYAMLFTSLIVVLGLSLLAFSDFIPSVLFGMLTGLSMAMALLFDFTLLAVLLRKFVLTPPRSKRHRPKALDAALPA